jgi:hypothetical protein
MRSEPEKLIIQSYAGLDRLANVVSNQAGMWKFR